MIKKIIFITLMLSTVSYAYNVNNESSFVDKEQKTYKAWPSDITSNASNKTCEDGNCILGSKCFSKDGPLPKFATKVSKEFKRLCKKF